MQKKGMLQQKIVTKMIKSELTTLSDCTSFEDLCYMSKSYKVKLVMKWMKERLFKPGIFYGDDEEKKEVFYGTMEILPGRIFSNNIMNLPEKEELLQIMRELDVSVNDVEDKESEPALGNGGLGRLGACLLESAATQGANVSVVTMRYRNGFFEQDIKNWHQEEHEEKWIGENGNFYFEKECKIEEHKIYFNNVCVKVTVCDIPQIGRGGKVNMIHALKVADVKAGNESDAELYYKIDERLYPDDTGVYGKKLRLAQEYTLSSAIVNMAVTKCRRMECPMSELSKTSFLHINDTHTSLMIPELLRILLDEEHMGWNDAYSIAEEMFGYTNHTILAEALEKWDEVLLKEMLPRVYEIIQEIHKRFKQKTEACGKLTEADRNRMLIIRDGKVHMAHMDICVAAHVNGVAELHTKILCESELAPFYKMMPEKFCNITNGVTQRKLLGEANPELTALISECIGSEEWMNDMSRLEEFLGYIDRNEVQCRARSIKYGNKAKLSKFIKEQRNIDIPPEFIFDIHIKRLHEYKRQQLKCLHIISLYQALKENPAMEMHPVAFIFAGKAAPSYRQAKLVIELILALERLVNNDPEINSKMRVCFVENYNVSKAELLFAAADVSEQISTAGYEASGTGNMKFMLNGALTIGTMDGANVEICEAVGEDNMFVFGLSSDDVKTYNQNPGSYNSWAFYEKNRKICHAVNALTDGTLTRINPPYGESDRFHDIYNEWLHGKDGNLPDRFFVLRDFYSYDNAFWRMNATYQHQAEWMKKSLLNIASAGRFSSDRMVQDYRQKVWKI